MPALKNEDGSAGSPFLVVTVVDDTVRDEVISAMTSNTHGCLIVPPVVAEASTQKEALHPSSSPSAPESGGCRLLALVMSTSIMALLTVFPPSELTKLTGLLPVGVCC